MKPSRRKRAERLIVGSVMGVIAGILDRRVRKKLRKSNERPRSQVQAEPEKP
jgi:hypothetical protein